MKGLMAHEIPMKAQLKTHKMCPTHTSTKVDVNGPEKCCTHLSIRNIKILPNLFKLRSIKFMMTHTNAKKNCVIKNCSHFLVQRNSFIDSCWQKFIILFVSIVCHLKLYFKPLLQPNWKCQRTRHKIYFMGHKNTVKRSEKYSQNLHDPLKIPH